MKADARLIIIAVAVFFRLTPEELKSRTNARRIARPRQIAMFLVRELTDYSLPQIGSMFGGKHHTTVLYSIEKIRENLPRDERLSSFVERCRELACGPA